VTRLLAGASFAGTVMGFVFNLLQLNLPPLGRGFFWPVLLGAAGVGVFAASTKKVRPLSRVALCIGGGRIHLDRRRAIGFWLARAGLTGLPDFSICHAMANPASTESADFGRCMGHLDQLGPLLSFAVVLCV
jgi:hypothetical protein